MTTTRSRVLIADDSMVVRAVIRKQLGGEGFELFEACDGDAALATCRAMAPDVVLLDVEMPGRTGYDVLATMQSDPVMAGIPVIFLSGQVSAEHVAEGLRLGAHDYLRKPVETGELLARVTAALRTKTLQDRLRRDNAQLRQLAPIDPLTGVLDVRGLQERLESLTEEARLQGRPLAGVLLDVQSLDTINNAFGWEAGDEVLRSLAELIRSTIGQGEVVGRCGPDEFLVLLPDTDEAAAALLARSLQARMSTTPVRLGADELTVRVAVGSAATVDADAEALLLLLQANVAAGGIVSPPPVLTEVPPPPGLFGSPVLAPFESPGLSTELAPSGGPVAPGVAESTETAETPDADPTDGELPEGDEPSRSRRRWSLTR